MGHGDSSRLEPVVRAHFRRALAFVFLASCGGESHEPRFEQLVPEVNRAFEECHAGRYDPDAEQTYSRASAISACQACWLGEERDGVPCNDETGRLCRELLGLSECDCEWVTGFDVEGHCRACLSESCGVDDVTEESFACAHEHCDRPDACELSGHCDVPLPE